MSCDLKGRQGRSGSEACQVQEELWGPVGMHSGRYERGGQQASSGLASNDQVSHALPSLQRKIRKGVYLGFGKSSLAACPSTAQSKERFTAVSSQGQSR